MFIAKKSFSLKKKLFSKTQPVRTNTNIVFTEEVEEKEPEIIEAVEAQPLEEEQKPKRSNRKNKKGNDEESSLAQ